MIDDTQLEHWKTKAEASEILKCSEKTISRLPPKSESKS